MENNPKGKNTTRTILKVLICVFALVTLGGSMLGYSLFQKINQSSNIKLNLFSKAENTPAPIYSQTEIDKFMTNVLIVVQNQPLNSENAPADMVFAVSFNAFEQKLAVISISPQMMIESDGNSLSVSDIYRQGGVIRLANALNENLGTGIQHYVCTDTHSLAAMTDLIGGISVRISKDEADYIANASSTDPGYGKVQLSGNHAMIHALDKTNGDYTTGVLERQLALVSSAVQNLRVTATKEAMLPILALVFSNVQTDMDIETLRGIGYDILKADEMEYTSFYLPIEGTWEYPSGLDEQNREVFDRDTVIADLQANRDHIKAELFSAE